MAYIPERVNLYAVLSRIENLDYFAALATGRRPPKDRLIALLVKAGLPRKAVTRRVWQWREMPQRHIVAQTGWRLALILLADVASRSCVKSPRM